MFSGMMTLKVHSRHGQARVTQLRNNWRQVAHWQHYSSGLASPSLLYTHTFYRSYSACITPSSLSCLSSCSTFSLNFPPFMPLQNRCASAVGRTQAMIRRLARQTDECHDVQAVRGRRRRLQIYIGCFSKYLSDLPAPPIIIW